MSPVCATSLPTIPRFLFIPSSGKSFPTQYTKFIFIFISLKALDEDFLKTFLENPVEHINRIFQSNVDCLLADSFKEVYNF